VPEGLTQVIEAEAGMPNVVAQCSFTFLAWSRSCSSRINGKVGHKARKHLYMIQCGPYTKIGTTDNIKIRLISLQSSNPYPIKLVGFWEDYGYKEKEWHKKLNHLHHQGEWFNLNKICEI